MLAIMAKARLPHPIMGIISKSLEVIALSAFLWLSPVKAEPYQGPSAGSAPLTVPDDAYPPHNLSGSEAHLLWNTGLNPGVDTGLEIIRNLYWTKDFSNLQNIKLELTSDGKGGQIQYFLVEFDGDVWWTPSGNSSALESNTKATVSFPVASLERAPWSTGDAIMDLDEVRIDAFNFYANSSLQLGERNIVLHKIIQDGTIHADYDFSDPMDLVLRTKSGNSSVECPDIQRVCDIWVPNEALRQQYLTRTGFVQSALIGSTTLELATPADVNFDLTRFGYPTSSKPPAFVPIIAYATETPIYPFVGQMVPGTDIKYTTPEIQAVWLVDIVQGATQDIVVPALTTIDFREFRSINWPRARYLEAILKANRGESDETISGVIGDVSKTLDGIVRVTGDITHSFGGTGTVIVNPGTVFVMTAGSSDYNHPWETPEQENKIGIYFFDKLVSEGTPQKPIIWTSNADNPTRDDWDYLYTGIGTSFKNNIVENESNTFTNGQSGSPSISHSIFRLSGNGLYIQHNNHIVRNNEFHNIHGLSIYHFIGSNNFFVENEFYNNRDQHAKGIFSDKVPSSTSSMNVYENTFTKCYVGISPEDLSDEQYYFHANTIAFNIVGALMYNWEAGSNPTIVDNNIYWNMDPTWLRHGVDNICTNSIYNKDPPINNYLKGSSNNPFSGLADCQYPDNQSFDPEFVNVKIWDFQQIPSEPSSSVDNFLLYN
jgi:hypothetical protein